MPSYSNVDSIWTDELKSVMSTNHPKLTEAGVTVSLLQAHGKRNAEGELTSPTLKSHGYPALALVKINNQRDRTDGLADATVIIDGDQFFDLSHEKQVAVLDHELEHLEVVYDEDGNIQLDDCNRPKLKMRLHDLFVGGFKSIVLRHGENAVEIGHIEAVNREVEEAMAGVNRSEF